MYGMDRWDVVLMVIAAYLALVVLVRMMAGRRNKLIGELREQMERHPSRGKKSKSKKDLKAARQDEAA